MHVRAMVQAGELRCCVAPSHQDCSSVTWQHPAAYGKGNAAKRTCKMFGASVDVVTPQLD